VLRAYGFVLNELWEDTLLAHHAAFPGCAHRLQQVTSQFFAVEPWKAEYRNQEETPEKLVLYNAKDTFSTAILRAPLEIIVKRNNVDNVYRRDLKMSEIASRMHLNGMPVSREVNTDLLNRFTQLSMEARRVVEEQVRDPKTKELIQHHLALMQASKRRKIDPEDFEVRYNNRLSTIKDSSWKWKINASKHVTALLQSIGVPLTQTTDKGDISTKKEVLEGLAHVPIVRDILKFREFDKVRGTFIWPIFDREVDNKIVKYGFADEGDRIHPIWSIHKISGRWASSEPVQSNPTKDRWRMIDGEAVLERPSTKRQIIAPKGRKFVGFDLAQVEARCIALISGDPFLLDVFATGKDIHTECAKVIFDGQGGSISWDAAGDGSPRSKAQKQMRDVTKNVEYGGFYGGSDETLWKTLLKEGFNVKLADVSLSVRKLKAKMPGVLRWQADTVRRASMPPYELRDFVDGRRRVWPLGQVEPSEALNIVPQMTTATIMNIGMERMDARLPKYKEAFPIVQVHDASVFECWADDAEKVQADVDECFPQAYERDGRTIPFPIESSIGDCWIDV
jgi:DNA polymerase I-like protein with 3'-5' exonuclease and polymerase domains